jgi:hypothetical protein
MPRLPLCVGMHRRIRIGLAALLCLTAAVSARTAHAQSIFGFKVGDDLRVVAKTHPKPSIIEPAGSFAAVKWNLSSGNDVSVTASPETGRIVYVKSDWGGDPKSAAIEVPGMQFGTTTLSDIRKKFGSNGFAFKSNLGGITDDNLVGLNCYQIDSNPDLIVVFVTTQPIKDVPTVAGKPKPDSGKGHLDAVILASLEYLKQIWGEDRIFDTTYHPVAWK